MKSFNKITLLNAGTKTRRDFVTGIPDTPCEHYHTKNILLHITNTGAIKFIHKNVPLDFTNAYVFTRLRGTDQQFCGILYDYFKYHKIPASDPINGSYVNSSEKISQMLQLALHGVPIPETFIFREESFVKNSAYLSEHLSFPAIYKTDGSRGRNVHYVESNDALNELLLKKKHHERALIQPYIENTFDTRTIVAYGTILGSIKRARTHGYLNNIAQGAIPSRYALTSSEEEIAIRAVHATGVDVGGVDLIHTPNGPIVLEVNKSPQIHGFESVHDFKVFSKIAEIIRKQLGS